jgi:putative oxidoreductase
MPSARPAGVGGIFAGVALPTTGARLEWQPRMLSILRLVVGPLYMEHGLSKLFDFPHLSGQMAVAYFLAHAPQHFFPLLNGGDAAILYCFIFFYLFVAGGGCWSLDRLRAAGS